MEMRIQIQENVRINKSNVSMETERQMVQTVQHGSRAHRPVCAEQRQARAGGGAGVCVSFVRNNAQAVAFRYMEIQAVGKEL